MNRTRLRLGFLAILLGLAMGLPTWARAAAPITRASANKAGFEQLWQLPVGISNSNLDSVAKIWRLGGNLYVLTHRGYMICIRAQVGVIRWTIKLPGIAASIFRPTAFNKAHEFILLVSGHILIIDARNGSIVHNRSLHFAPGTNPVVGPDLILIGSLHDCMFALSPTWPPRQLWFKLDKGGSFVTDPVMADGLAIFGSREGTIVARDLEDGTGGWTRHVGGHLLASPALLNSVAYFPCMDNNVYAVNTQNGISPWIVHLPGFLDFTPSIIQNHLLIPSGHVGLFSLSMKTGVRQWGPVPHGFRVVGRNAGEIYVATTDGKIVVVSLTTGHILKAMNYDLPSIFLRNSVSSTIFLTSVTGEVEALKPLPRQ